MVNRKLCGHWTAGTYNPCNEDIVAYHYLVDGTGRIFKGKYKIEDNDNCQDGIYAKHCGGGNTGCIGIAMCAMAGFDMRNKKTKYPITAKQFEAFCALAAYLSVNYGIPAPYWLLSIFIWIGILLIIQRIMPVMEVTNPVSQIGICILCILICLPTMFAPYLSGSLLLILICFHYGYKAECAAALLLFIYAVSKYYYDLNLSLLVKSITLFFTGIIFMIAWYYFTQKRMKHEKTESDTDYH